MGLAVVHGVGNQRQGDQASGQHAGDEEITHRLAGGQTVHDKGNAGGNDDAQSAGSGYKRGGKFQAVSQIGQNGNAHGADGRDSRRRGSGNRAIEQTGDNYRDGQSRRQHSQKVGEKVKQTLGNTALCHQNAGDNKQRHRQHRLHVNGRNKVSDAIGRRGHHRRVDNGGEYAGNRNADADGNADGQQHEEHNKQNGYGIHNVPSFDCLPAARRALTER